MLLNGCRCAVQTVNQLLRHCQRTAGKHRMPQQIPVCSTASQIIPIHHIVYLRYKIT